MARWFLGVLAATLVVGCAAEGAARKPVDAKAATRAEDDDDAAQALAAGREALGRGAWADAEAAFRKAASEAPADPAPHVGLAEVRQGQGRTEEALRELDQALALGESAALQTLRGRWLGVARRPDEAARALEQAVAIEPTNGAAWAALTAVEVLRGDEAGRDRAFARAVAALGRVKAVDASWVQIRAMAPDPVQPQESLDRCTRGYAAMLDGQWIDAQREQLSALRYAPGFLWCIAGIAETTWRLGDPERAEKILRRVVAEYPAQQAPLRADAEGRLAALLLDQGRAAEAADLARRALSERGERAALLERLARACRATGDAACAQDAAARLLKLPWLPEGLAAQARTWQAAN